VHARGRTWSQLIFQDLLKKEKQSIYDRVIWPEKYDPKTSAIYALNDIDVKSPFLFLASDENSFMTGSDMLVDGGISNADGGHPSTGIGRSDRRPLEIASADQRHVGRDPEPELSATTDVETNMTDAPL
jgi:hypothetical protein